MSHLPELSSRTYQPLIALTPLYNFSSDSEDLRIGNDFRVQGFSDGLLPIPIQTSDICIRHLEVYPPDYILWQVPDVPPTGGIELISREQPEAQAAGICSVFLTPKMNLFHELRLFKPDRLVAGETVVLANQEQQEKEGWATAVNQRASLMGIDYALLVHQRERYELPSAELPFLQIFIKALSPLLESLAKADCPYRQLKLALELFGRNDGPENEVLYSFTALEGLLTNDSTSELAYRLALRVASLLGTDDISHKRLFKEMKGFYDLRSKIVHGSELKPKNESSLDQVPNLREHLRRVLLRYMALLVNGIQPKQIEELLDEMVFDESARKKVYSESTKFIHLADPSTGQTC